MRPVRFALLPVLSLALLLVLPHAARAAGPGSCPEATGREATIVLPKKSALPASVLEGVSLENVTLVVSTAAVGCVGQAAWHADLRALVVHGDDPLTEEVDGAQPGDLLEFQLYDAAGRPVAASFSLTLDGDACRGCQSSFTYQHDGIIVIAALEGHTSVPVEDTPALTPGVGAPYPSPAFADVRLPVHLAEAQHVRVVIYDALGREVYRPHDGLLPAGPSLVSFSASAFSSGTYLVRVSSKSLAETRSFVVAH